LLGGEPVRLEREADSSAKAVFHGWGFPSMDVSISMTSVISDERDLDISPCRKSNSHTAPRDTEAPIYPKVCSIVVGVISPLLANLFLHYAFDAWMARHNPHIPFERYADDIVCHCRTEAQAQELWRALGDRFADCRLELHPQKTKIVYCKDVNRPGDFLVIAFDFLGFQFRARKTMWGKGGKRVFTHSFQPAVSPGALKSISRKVKRWRLHIRSDMPLDELAKIANPHVRGWISYFSNFYRTALRPTLKRIDDYVIRWARRKFKRLRRKTKGSRDWFDRLRRADPNLFAHWQLCHGNGRTSGAV
jgi:hypothetical protein